MLYSSFTSGKGSRENRGMDHGRIRRDWSGREHEFMHYGLQKSPSSFVHSNTLSNFHFQTKMGPAAFPKPSILGARIWAPGVHTWKVMHFKMKTLMWTQTGCFGSHPSVGDASGFHLNRLNAARSLSPSRLRALSMGNGTIWLPQKGGSDSSSKVSVGCLRAEADFAQNECVEIIRLLHSVVKHGWIDLV